MSRTLDHTAQAEKEATDCKAIAYRVDRTTHAVVPIPASPNFFEEVARALRHRVVARSERGSVLISTVFLVIDHRNVGLEHDEPILFETMIFGGAHDGWCERTTTWTRALDLHNQAIALVQGECR